MQWGEGTRVRESRACREVRVRQPADWYSKDMFVSGCEVESASSESCGPGAKVLRYEEALQST